uniref:Uncharacterized protein n=1 Tax=Tanacetum cinerariifolium TaxID=118510 RepID=A0A699J6C6_TANCI|nr:hypothetical protein [Tanacetum cinerariifolium]
MDGGDNGDDNDDDSSEDDADDEDEDEEEEEEEEEHLASADSTVVIPTNELVALPEGTEPVIPPPYTDTATTGARITIRLQATISLPPEAEVEILLAMPTLSSPPLTSLTPPSAKKCLARCMTPAALPSPPLPLPLHMPPPSDRERKAKKGQNRIKTDKNRKRGEAGKSQMQLYYHLNPRYTIKECSSCGTLYTRDCVCSKRNVEDKILILKPPKNCARCTRCGYLVDGPNCQGCALLRQELEENLVTHSQDFQNTFESSNVSTNVVNAPRESFVVKQDHRSFVDKIIFDLNRAPDSPNLHTISPNQFRCFHCKDVLRDGEACKRCTCAKCGSGLGEGLCYICGNNQNSLNDSPRISETSSQSPPHINHCCYECGDPLDDIFCKRCTCKVHQQFRLTLT